MRRPTGIQEVAGSISGPAPSFVEIWHWMISTTILSLPLIQVRQFLVTDEKYGHLVLLNHLGSLPRNSVDRLTDRARNDLNSVEEP